MNFAKYITIFWFRPCAAEPNEGSAGRMEVQADYIPAQKDSHFLFKLFNVQVPVQRRAFREHQHIYFEISLFKQGAGVYTTHDDAYPIQPGDVFVFASNEVHCITEITAPLALMNVHFEPRFLWSGSDSAAPFRGMLCFGHGASFRNRLPPEQAASARIRQLLLETEAEMAGRAPEYERMVRLKLSEIFIHLVRSLHYADGLTENATLSRHMSAVNRAMDYIGTHLAEPLTLAEIAAQAQMSPSYFSAVFRRIHSVPLWDYIAEKRVELAMRLLDSPQISITEAAMRAGFNNSANFNRTFLRCTGITPREYRRHDGAAWV